MKKVFLILTVAGLIQASYAQSVIHPDSISVKSLKVTGLSGSGEQQAYISANGIIYGKRTGSIFIPAAAFQPVDYTPNFHNDGSSCYFDIGTLNKGLVAPVSLPYGVTITNVNYFVQIFGSLGSTLICALKKAPFSPSVTNHSGSSVVAESDVTVVNVPLGPGQGGVYIRGAITNFKITNETGIRTPLFLKVTTNTGTWHGGMVLGSPPVTPNKLYGVEIIYNFD